MFVSAAAGAFTLLLTTLLTLAGVGAAFILIPVFTALGIDLHRAMATALLLNVVAMTSASYRFIKKKLVLWKVALPILLVASVTSPLGAWVSQRLNREILLWMFTAFLLFAAFMMLFFKSNPREKEASYTRQIVFGVGVGAWAGFLGGLLGVGGGNFIVPALVWLGIKPQHAAATTSFIVIFSSLSGFAGHASLGHIDLSLLGFTALGSALGAMLGAWLMTEKLKQKQIKQAIAMVLVVIAAKMMWNLTG